MPLQCVPVLVGRSGECVPLVEARKRQSYHDKFGDVVTIGPHVPLQTIPKQILRSQLIERLSIEEAGMRCSRRPRRNRRR
jgi:hypothetical protein